MSSDIMRTPSNLPEAIGQSDSFLAFQDQISQVAPINRPVLIIGERGTGKELAAARIHYLSGRWQKNLVTLNCSSLTPGLIGSELFGYEKGAFTGAAARQPGRFEIASEGTLFLDEIGTIPMEVQEKILRVVEYNRFERVGSPQPVSVDVRIVAATNANLPAMAAAGQFKQDLLDRLSFEVIFVPPLREREGDILLIADHFAQRMAYELGRPQIPRFSEKAALALETYAWPGNIRELKNVIERAVYRSATPVISNIHFNPFDSPLSKYLNPSGTNGAPVDVMERLNHMPIKEAVLTLEKTRLSNALETCRHNQKKAARILGLTYDQFRGLKKKHRL